MAAYYDTIYHSIVDYNSECEFLEKLFRKHSTWRVHSILDVGCGTGNHSTILSEKGYRVVGIDKSDAMLQVARRKLDKSANNPQFERIDMRRITLKERFDAALILFAAFTYLLKDADVVSCLSSIREHIERKGLLIFEFWHTPGIVPSSESNRGRRDWDRIEDKEKHRLILRLNTSIYSSLTNFLTVVFDHYIIDSRKRQMTDQFQETHVMRTYNITEMMGLLRKSGFADEPAFYAKGVEYPPKPPTLSTGRVLCVARPVRR